MEDKAAPELTAELLAESVMPRHPVISPDGRWVAYLAVPVSVREHQVSSLWLIPVDASSPPRELTSGTTWVQAPQWAPDSGFLWFVSDEQLHRFRPDGTGAAETLTGWRAPVSGYLPLADGLRAAVLARDEPSAEDERRQAERDDAMVWSEQRSHDRLRLLDLGTRELTVVSGLGDRHVVGVVQRPDGGPLAVISWDRPEDEPGLFTARLHIVDLETGQVRDLGPLELDASSPAWWNADGHWHLTYLAVAPPGPVGGIAVLDVIVPAADAVGAAGKHRNLTAGMGACPTELVQVTGGPPLALFAEGLDTALHQLDPGTQRFRRMVGWAGQVDMLTASGHGDVIAARLSTAHQPAEVHAGPWDGPLTRLSDTRPELRGISWGTQERLSYQARDGLELDGLLILPPGMNRQDGPFPLVTLVHGGPDSRYADEFMGTWGHPGQWLATAGYAVFLPNPRGGIGHGEEFAAMVAGAVGTDEWTDIVSGIDLLIDEGVADPDRLGIGGWSHGGFMAAWAVGQTGRFKAALMGAGISDWGLQVGVGEFGTWEAGLGGSCGWEGPGPHRHDQLSPISYASKVSTPVLILHGEQDTNVPVGQAMYFHRALSQFGVEHELVIYPREGHSIDERSHQIDLLRRTRAWFGRWLTDPAPKE